MAEVNIVRTESHPAAYVLLYSSRGIAEGMFRYGLKVETRAKLELTLNPPRVDTGRLRASVNTRRIHRGTLPGARVGSNVFYAIYVHEGTGIYGRYRRPIRPVRAKVLRFKPKGSTGYAFAQSVKGMRPNPFLVKALRSLRRR